MKSRGNKKTTYDPLMPQPHEKELKKYIIAQRIQSEQAMRETYAALGITPPQPPHRLIEMNTRGEILYKGKTVSLENPEALYAKVLRAIIKDQDAAGYAPYEAINRSIELAGAPKEKDREKMVKRIRNAVDGIFRYVPVLKTTPTGDPVIGIRDGKGITLNNPLLDR